MNQLTVKSSKKRTHANHASWTIRGNEPLFGHVVTIDPDSVMTSWGTLGQDTWAAEFQGMPALMHTVFVKTLKNRGVIEE